jgi:hypothetical protein
VSSAAATDSGEAVRPHPTLGRAHWHSSGFGQAVALGALCNALVCLAVWLTYAPTRRRTRSLRSSRRSRPSSPSASSTLIKLDDTWLHATAGLPDTDGLTWSAFVFDNLIPVTIGNVIGGGLMVGVVYWFVYLRPRAGGAARSRSGRGRAAAQSGTYGD